MTQSSDRGAEWAKEANKRLNVILKSFKRSEVLAIIDFIRTAENVTEKELGR